MREGLRRAAARPRRTLVSATVELGSIDPCATVFASRLASDRWFCWEQPDRGFALAALGVAQEVTSRGERRFAEVGVECLAIGRDAIVAQPPGLPAGAGPVWTGGFAFATEGGSSPPWSSLPPAAMFLPQLSICAVGERAFLSANAVLEPGEDPESRLESLTSRLAGLRAAPLPMIDPHPTARVEIRSAHPPAEFEATVAEATERIEGEPCARSCSPGR